MLEVMTKSMAPIPLDLSFQVAEGEILALVGHSGSGKSTVLRVIAGLHDVQRARIVVGGSVWADTDLGINLPTPHRRVGIVVQNYALFPHMTAEANVMSAMDHLPRPSRQAEAARLLELVNLGDIASRRPAQLSGGQQQRVAVARALARQPEVLLLDEPFSAVDRATREQMYREIHDLRRVLNMPVVLVTHDMTEAQMLADRMVVIEDGRMLASGTAAEILFDPAALRGVGLREASAILPARIAAQEDDGLTLLDTSAGPLLLPRVQGAPGTQVRVRIMAHEVILSRDAPKGLSALNILPVSIVALRRGEGPGTLVELMAGNDTILARITHRSAKAMSLLPGNNCFAIIKSMGVAQDNVGVSAKPE